MPCLVAAVRKFIPRGAVARGTMRTSLALGVRVIVQAGTLVFLGRHLGATVFGIYSSLAAIAIILGALVPFGMNIVLLQSIAQGHESRHALLAEALPLALASGVVMLVAYGVLTSALLAIEPVDWVVVAGLGLSEIVLQPPIQFVSAELQATGKVARSQWIATLPLVLKFLGAVALGFIEYSDVLRGFIYFYVAGSVCSLAVALYHLPAAWPALAEWRWPRLATVRRASGYVSLSLSNISMTEVDKAVAVRVLSAGNVGLYALGARIVGAFVLPIVAMMLVVIPRILRAGNDRLREQARLVGMVAGASAIYTLAAASVIWLGAPGIEALFGGRFDGLVFTLHWSVILLPPMGFRLAAGHLLIALRQPWKRVGIELAAVLAFVVMAVLLTRSYSLPGMFVAAAMAEGGAALVGWVIVLRLVLRGPQDLPIEKRDPAV